MSDGSDDSLTMEGLDAMMKESQQGWQDEVNKILKGLMKRLCNQEQKYREENEELMGWKNRATEEIRDLKKKLENVERSAAADKGHFEDEIQYFFSELDRNFATKRDVSDIQDQLRNTIDRHPGPIRINTNMKPKQYIKMTPPTYEDRADEKPIKFLRDLNEYCAVTQAEPEEARYVVSQALKGAAGEWWRLVQDEIGDWQTFEKRFIAKFWSEGRQNGIRKNMEFGHYEVEGKISRCEYAMQIFGLAKDLTRKPSEQEVIAQMANHFNEEIRAAIFSREINNKERLFQMLERFDNAGGLNRNKCENPDIKLSEPRRSGEESKVYNRRWDSLYNNNNNNSSRNFQNQSENGIRNDNNARSIIITITHREDTPINKIIVTVITVIIIRIQIGIIIHMLIGIIFTVIVMIEKEST